MKKIALLEPWRLVALLAVSLAAPLHAAAPAAAAGSTVGINSDLPPKVAQFLQSLRLQTGTIDIAPAHAELLLKPGYSFLGPSDAQHVLSDFWRNPPDKNVLGMILPSTDPRTLLDPSAWTVVVTYVSEGHVPDEDAGKIDYEKMLTQMQLAMHEANPQRIKSGYPALDLVGWAEPPHYDAATHKLYWARDLKFTQASGNPGGHPIDYLNYDIRVLGRQGFLSLNAVAPIGQLAKVKQDMPAVLAMADFDPGQRYADYDTKTDRLAAYGIGALVAGGIAVKAGLFAKLGLLLLAMKKFILLGIAAIGSVFAKWFKRKSR